MRSMIIVIRVLMLITVTTFLAAPPAHGEGKKPKKAAKSSRGVNLARKGSGNRLALVIGNSAYLQIGQLQNPVNDAKLIASTLKEVGFELYGGKAQMNLSRDEMLTAIENFGDRIRPGDTALFFYAGHGMQVKGDNYLIPVDAKIKSEAETRVKAVDVNLLMAKFEAAKNQVNIVILDACRDNPFARSFRSSAGGLAQVTAPSGTIIAYSTAPNHVAEDGSDGHSTYSERLASFMKTPGLRVEDVFKRVRVAVEETTNGNQQPWENTSLKGDFVFVEGSAPASAPASASAQDDEERRKLQREAKEAKEEARRAKKQAEKERQARLKSEKEQEERQRDSEAERVERVERVDRSNEFSTKANLPPGARVTAVRAFDESSGQRVPVRLSKFRVQGDNLVVTTADYFPKGNPFYFEWDYQTQNRRPNIVFGGNPGGGPGPGPGGGRRPGPDGPSLPFQR